VWSPDEEDGEGQDNRLRAFLETASTPAPIEAGIDSTVGDDEDNHNVGDDAEGDNVASDVTRAIADVDDFDDGCFISYMSQAAISISHELVRSKESDEE
jgi:hypothetical protein